MTDAWDGMPENPKRDGWHWLAYLDPTMPPQPDWWSASEQAWQGTRGSWVTPQHRADYFHYLGPCLTPDEVAAREAASAEAMREACVKAAQTMRCFMMDGVSEEVDGPTQDAIADYLTTLAIPHADALARGTSHE